MNKGNLAEKIAQDTGLSKKAAMRVIDIMLQKITKRLRKGKTFTFVGFGTFRVVDRKKRKGRNPRTGEVIKIPATLMPRFSAGSELRKAVNQMEPAETSKNRDDLS